MPASSMEPTSSPGTPMTRSAAAVRPRRRLASVIPNRSSSLGRAGNARRRLRDPDAPREVETVGRPVDERHGAVPEEIAERFPGRPHREVREAVAIKIPERHGLAKEVPWLRGAGQRSRVLRQHLDVGGGLPRGAGLDHEHAASAAVARLDPEVGCPERDLVAAVAVDVARVQHPQDLAVPVRLQAEHIPAPFDRAGGIEPGRRTGDDGDPWAVAARQHEEVRVCVPVDVARRERIGRETKRNGPRHVEACRAAGHDARRR